MRSTSNGPLTTLLMFVPLLAVPAMAIFGTPQFSTERDDPSEERAAIDERPSFDPGIGESAHHGADDLFAPTGDRRPDHHHHRRDAAGRASWDESANRYEQASFDAPEAQSTGADRGRPVRQDREFGFADPSEPRQSRDRLTRASQEFDASFEDQAGSRSRPRATAMHAIGTDRAGQALAPEGNSFLSVQDDPLAQPAPRTRAQQALDSRARQPSQFRESFAFEDEPAAEPVNNAAAEEPNPFATRTTDEMTHPVLRRTEDTPAPVTTSATLTWQQAVQQLNALGIQNFQLQPGADPSQFHFSCLFTPRDNPRLTHRFEAEAGEPLDAVTAVIVQVETWLEQQ